MNNQAHIHPHYTLPGVMHYLQTEFTKNERDRIAWELERSEMKARIAQLEGENKDLNYQLMNMNMNMKPDAANSEVPLNVGGSDLSALVKSKIAVQENVKEIIYLFKSPHITTQLGTLNEKRDPIHEIEKLNLNEPIENNSGQSPSMSQNGGVSEIDLRQEQALQEATNGEYPKDQDTNSDAATMILGREDEDDIVPSEARRRRSSSLFSPLKVAPVETMKNELDVKDVSNTSSLFQSSTSYSSAIMTLKVFENEIVSYSENGQLSYWRIENSEICSEKPITAFHGLESTLFDIYWLDSDRFLTLDGVGIKLYSTKDEKPISNFNIFGNKESDTGFEGLKLSDVRAHDFKNNFLLLATPEKIYLTEISISTSNERISRGKNYNIDVSKNILAAKFGITEKSLIVFYGEPYELVIYNFKGKVLQEIDLSKFITSPLGKNSKPMLFLNKKSSKLLIILQKLVLLYSFDQKKMILKQTLKSHPINIIFKSFQDHVAIAYENGVIEVRSIKDFGTIMKKYNYSDESSAKKETSTSANSQSQSSFKSITTIDSTVINSMTVIVSGDTNGKITLRKVPEVSED